MFTQLIIDPTSLDPTGVASALRESHPGKDPTAFAAGVIAARLRGQPQKYLEFGPYWWAVKAVLRGQGEDFGAADDELVRQAYGGSLLPQIALIAAEQFKDFARGRYLVGNRLFVLDESGDSYVLFDPDMEALALGRRA